MSYIRRNTTDGITRMNKDLYDNLQDGIDTSMYVGSDTNVQSGSNYTGPTSNGGVDIVRVDGNTEVEGNSELSTSTFNSQISNQVYLDGENNTVGNITIQGYSLMQYQYLYPIGYNSSASNIKFELKNFNYSTRSINNSLGNNGYNSYLMYTYTGLQPSSSSNSTVEQIQLATTSMPTLIRGCKYVFTIDFDLTQYSFPISKSSGYVTVSPSYNDGCKILKGSTEKVEFDVPDCTKGLQRIVIYFEVTKSKISTLNLLDILLPSGVNDDENGMQIVIQNAMLFNMTTMYGASIEPSFNNDEDLLSRLGLGDYTYIKLNTNGKVLGFNYNLDFRDAQNTRVFYSNLSPYAQTNGVYDTFNNVYIADEYNILNDVQATSITRFKQTSCSRGNINTNAYDKYAVKMEGLENYAICKVDTPTNMVKGGAFRHCLYPSYNIKQFESTNIDISSLPDIMFIWGGDNLLFAVSFDLTSYTKDSATNKNIADVCYAYLGLQSIYCIYQTAPVQNSHNYPSDIKVITKLNEAIKENGSHYYTISLYNNYDMDSVWGNVIMDIYREPISPVSQQSIDGVWGVTSHVEELDINRFINPKDSYENYWDYINQNVPYELYSIDDTKDYYYPNLHKRGMLSGVDSRISMTDLIWKQLTAKNRWKLRVSRATLEDLDPLTITNERMLDTSAIVLNKNYKLCGVEDGSSSDCKYKLVESYEEDLNKFDEVGIYVYVNKLTDTKNIYFVSEANTSLDEEVMWYRSINYDVYSDINLSMTQHNIGIHSLLGNTIFWRVTLSSNVSFYSYSYTIPSMKYERMGKILCSDYGSSEKFFTDSSNLNCEYGIYSSWRGISIKNTHITNGLAFCNSIDGVEIYYKYEKPHYTACVPYFKTIETHPMKQSNIYFTNGDGNVNVEYLVNNAISSNTKTYIDNIKTYALGENLLDNSNFKIWQRSQNNPTDGVEINASSTSTPQYHADRWCSAYFKGTLVYQEGDNSGITIDNSDNSSVYITQFLHEPLNTNKQYVMSCSIDGEVYTTQPFYGGECVSGGRLIYNISTHEYVQVKLFKGEVLNWVKLEEGTNHTSYKEPDNKLETLKCKFEFNYLGTITFYSKTLPSSTSCSQYFCNVIFPIRMRANPTLACYNEVCTDYRLSTTTTINTTPTFAGDTYRIRSVGLSSNVSYSYVYVRGVYADASIYESVSR